MAAATDLYIGLMSGTSMDSFDGVLIDFSPAHPQLLATAKQPLDESQKKLLLNLCASFDSQGRSSEPQRLAELDKQLAEQFATVALQLLQQSGIQAQHICAIGSHGQTIFHQPPSANRLGFSLQIGNPQQIAQLSGIRTVGDFRNADMQAGGQGAPLVPAFHRAVFHSPENNRVIANIGGMANITVLPTRGKVTGFDTGPGNVLMDGWIHRHNKRPYDINGNWAAQEKADHELLHALLAEPFFSQAPPKSTGRELFNMTWLEQRLQALHRSVSPAVVQATLASLTAITLSEAIQHYAISTEEIYVCGGGAHNTHLMKLLQQHSHLPVKDTDTLGIDPDWVEAAAFAWLAKQTIEGKPGNLPEVTGATRPVVLGKIFEAEKQH